MILSYKEAGDSEDVLRYQQLNSIWASREDDKVLQRVFKLVRSFISKLRFEGVLQEIIEEANVSQGYVYAMQEEMITFQVLSFLVTLKGGECKVYVHLESSDGGYPKVVTINYERGKPSVSFSFHSFPKTTSRSDCCVTLP